MTKVLRTQVDVVLPSGAAVLQRRRPAGRRSGPTCAMAVVLYAQDASAAIAGTPPPATGPRRVSCQGGRVVLATGGSEAGHCPLSALCFGRKQHPRRT